MLKDDNKSGKIKYYNPIKIDNFKELKNACGIYQIRNTINNHLYIGSSKNLYQRYKRHFCHLKWNKHDNTHLQNAYNKYGEKYIVFEVIEYCNSDERFLFEQYWIDSFFGKNCYNINPKASNPPSKKGKKLVFSKTHKENLSKSSKRRYEENPELRKQMSLARIGKNLGAEHINSKSVVCLETGVVYGGISEASRKTNCNRNDISKCCHGKRYSSNNLHWRFYEDYIKLSKNDIQCITFEETIGKHVVCLETRKRYKKVIDAQTETGTERNNIIDCCNNKMIEANGYHWVYYNEYIKMSEEDINIKLKEHSKAFRRCMCIETNEIFNKISEAAKKLNLSSSKISLVCQGLRNHTKGYHFKYVD